jgi:hypothetical protein
MTDNVPPASETDELPSLPDVSGQALHDFLQSSESALAQASHRVIEEIKNRRENYAAFGNTA